MSPFLPAGLLLLLALASPARAEAAGPGVEFVHVTDLHVGGAEAEAAVGAILRRIDAAYPKLDFIAVTGDNVNRGSRPEEVERYRKAVSGLRAPLHVAPGNHDLDDDGRVPPGLAERPYHSFDTGGVHFAAVDVFGARPEEEVWLEADLTQAARKGLPVILFAHDALGREHRGGVHLRDAVLRSRADVIALRPDNFARFGGPRLRKALGVRSADSVNYLRDEQRRDFPITGLPSTDSFAAFRSETSKERAARFWPATASLRAYIAHAMRARRSWSRLKIARPNSATIIRSEH